MKTAISVPDDLFRAAERLASKLGIARSQLYTRALEKYLAQDEERDVTERLNKIYAHERSDLDPALSAMQSASLKPEKW